MRKSKVSAARRRRPRSASRKRVSPAAAVEEKLAELAHEIRTPLTGILALSELLASSGLAERERAWVGTIKNTAEHLARLTSVVVDAARARRKGLILRAEIFSPPRLAAALVGSLAARAEAKGLTHSADIADDLPQQVRGDPVRLRAALENLIDNAIKFTERGSVLLTVTSKRAAGRKRHLTFTVADSGFGLSRREISALFKPFAQANAQVARRFGGAGLGLAFVKRIARAMGGDLEVASEAGRGSRFALTVTVEEVSDRIAAPERALPAAATPRPLRVLCAEDNPYGRVVLNTILTELGHRPDFVSTGAAAVEAVAQASYDAVLMDVALPDIDGIEATRRIRALPGTEARVPIVGVSGRDAPADQSAGHAAGMNGYISKPLSPSALLDVLHSVTASA
ncbi:MAG: ATP-binding protein [Xanthobacteraceae bacterium]